MLNPDCTIGTIKPDPADPELFIAVCGCGNITRGFPSKTKAKAAQRNHRFPPQEPLGEDPFATAALHERTNP